MLERKWTRDTLLQEEVKGSIVIEDIVLDHDVLHEKDISDICQILLERYSSQPIPKENYPNPNFSGKGKVYKGNDY